VLVTLVLGTTILKDFLRKQYIPRHEACKIGLGLSPDLFARFYLQTVAVADYDDGIAFSDVIPLALLCRKHNAARGIDFEVVDLPVG
jgi:hypothetical protein